ncbi:DUF397 domain-containing protein [Actinokineospora baliensis]|uniref:DUF397 domain-containing protein n=1 Tax=Actinokineospora baliensis TaxID=547056 RepID=UPI0027DE9468|nr:DUF397 domain-containing protein [Actinokineospora baliensis]
MGPGKRGHRRGTTMREMSSWRRSTRSLGGNCVEIARATNRVLVRDSKNPRQILDIPAPPAEFFLHHLGCGVA